MSNYTTSKLILLELIVVTICSSLKLCQLRTTSYIVVTHLHVACALPGLKHIISKPVVVEVAVVSFLNLEG